MKQVYLQIKTDPETKRKLKELAALRDSDMSKEVRNMIRREYQAQMSKTPCDEVSK